MEGMKTDSGDREATMAQVGRQKIIGRGLLLELRRSNEAFEGIIQGIASEIQGNQGAPSLGELP